MHGLGQVNVSTDVRFDTTISAKYQSRFIGNYSIRVLLGLCIARDFYEKFVVTPSVCLSTC